MRPSRRFVARRLGILLSAFLVLWVSGSFLLHFFESEWRLMHCIFTIFGLLTCSSYDFGIPQSGLARAVVLIWSALGVVLIMTLATTLLVPGIEKNVARVFVDAKAGIKKTVFEEIKFKKGAKK